MSYYAAVGGSDYLRILSLILLGIASAVFSIVVLKNIFEKIPDFPTQAFLVKYKVDRYFGRILNNLLLNF